MVIDAENHTLQTTIELPSIATLVLGRDGNIWAADGNALVRINPVSFETWTRSLPSGCRVADTWGAWNAGSLCAAYKSNLLYFADESKNKVVRYNIDTDELNASFFTLPDQDGEYVQMFYGAGLRVDPQTDNVVVTSTESGYLSHYMNNWIHIVDGTNGELLNTLLPEKYYWFPAMPVFPDNEYPVISISDNLSVGSFPVKISLLESVSDADNLSAAIVSTVKVEDPSILSARIEGYDLILSGEKLGDTSFTLAVNSNGRVETKMVSALLAVVLSTAAFSITAFASGGEESTESVTEQETVGDVSDLLSALAGSQVTVSVAEDGIQFSSGENNSGQTGTVTTGGGNLNVRTGAGMDYTAFTQLPNGTTVKVIGTDGDWLKVILPEKIGYVYSGYMTVSDGEAGSGEGSFSLDAETLENLLGMLGGGLNGGAALTPDGNLSLIDDIGSPTTSGKQFITVETKNGNVFYLIIDRDDEGEETVHFLNQVDEADLMALTEDGGKAETPIVCTCTEKCQAGAVNTSCPVCVKNLSECVGTEQKAAEPTEPENPEPEKKSNTGAILAVLLILAAGGGAAVYFLVLKPKQGKKVPADLDDFDLEDEEEYLTEDEETEEKNE